MGGVAGTIPSNFTQTTMEIDYVRVYQNVAVDNQSPTILLHRKHQFFYRMLLKCFR